MADELMIIDDWVDALPEETHMRVFARALSALGVPYTLKTDSNEPEFDMDDLPDHALINEAMSTEYKRLHAAELLDDMVAKGVITPDHVTEDGDIFYVPVTDLD